MQLFQNITEKIIQHYQLVGLFIILAMMVYLYTTHPKEKKVVKKRTSKKEKIVYKAIYQTNDVLLQERITYGNYIPSYPIDTKKPIWIRMFAFVIVMFIVFIPLYKLLRIEPFYYFHTCLFHI